MAMQKSVLGDVGWWRSLTDLDKDEDRFYLIEVSYLD